MALGYDGKLYILAFDHRGSFQKKMFGIEGDPTPEEAKTITDAKRLVFEGMEKAGLLTLGRFGQYNYHNSDHCILDAMKLAERLIREAKA